MILIERTKARISIFISLPHRKVWLFKNLRANRTTQTLGDRIEQHVTANTRQYEFRQREQLLRNFKQPPLTVILP